MFCLLNVVSGPSTTSLFGPMVYFPSRPAVNVSPGLPVMRPATSAAARYLSTSPQKGKIKLTGLGFPNQMRKYVKNGTVDEFQLWVPKDVGYLAGQAAAALQAGRITGKEGETFTAGRLGDYTIGKNGEIVLGPLTTFDKNNIDKFDF